MSRSTQSRGRRGWYPLEQRTNKLANRGNEVVLRGVARAALRRRVHVEELEAGATTRAGGVALRVATGVERELRVTGAHRDAVWRCQMTGCSARGCRCEEDEEEEGREQVGVTLPSTGRRLVQPDGGASQCPEDAVKAYSSLPACEQAELASTSRDLLKLALAERNVVNAG